MMERRVLVAANWKMHGQRRQNDALVQALLAGLSSACTGESGTPESDAPEIVICPPSIYLGQLQTQLEKSQLILGAQNLFTEDKGAYTGEISAPMLVDYGCRYVIVGHSERRCLFNENDELVAAKFVAAQRAGLIPILCVGETGQQRESGFTEQTVSTQLDRVLQKVGIQAFGNAVIAYEPVWAIGTGVTASPAQAQAVHALIRARIADHAGEIARKLRIIYGGSVNATNAGDLIAETDIDGALVGGASLIAEQFVAICKSMNRNSGVASA